MKNTFKILAISMTILLCACGKKNEVTVAPYPSPAAIEMANPTSVKPQSIASSPVPPFWLQDTDKKKEYIELAKLKGKVSAKGEDCVQVCMMASDMPQCRLFINMNGCYVDPNALIRSRRSSF